jgi:uncharacterized protein YyaL (SSP411 family)
VVAGDSARAEVRDCVQAAHSVYQPNKVVLGTTGPVEEFAKTLPAKEAATVYICTGRACLPPTSDPAQVKSLLAAKKK